MKKIPIFFACDDNYIPFLGTALHTLIKNASKEYLYEIIVLSDELLEVNKKRIKALETRNMKVTFFNITAAIKEYKDSLSFRLRDYYSVAIYYRMFIPTLFPQYKKALYLDADLILLGDISELYNTDIDGKLVGAINDRLVKDVEVFAKYANEAVGIPADEYFNSGVLVMNLEKFRTMDILGQFLTLLHQYNFDTVAPDQDYLNVLCRNDKVLLPIGWNKMPLPDPDFDLKTLKLLHFNSFEKPWHYDHVLFSALFWQEARTSPFYEDLLNIRARVDEEHISREKQGTENLINKALQIAESEEVTFKKVLAL